MFRQIWDSLLHSSENSLPQNQEEVEREEKILVYSTLAETIASKISESEDACLFAILTLCKEEDSFILDWAEERAGTWEKHKDSISQSKTKITSKVIIIQVTYKSSKDKDIINREIEIFILQNDKPLKINHKSEIPSTSATSEIKTELAKTNSSITYKLYPRSSNG